MHSSSDLFFATTSNYLHKEPLDAQALLSFQEIKQEMRIAHAITYQVL